MSTPPPRGEPRFAAPYVVAAPGRLPTPPSAPRRRALGVLALVLAAVAAGAAIAVAVVVAARLGGSGAAVAWLDTDGDPRALAPVRAWILVGEVSFWACTALGIASIAVGAAAIARRSARALAIAAVTTAIVAPLAAFGIGAATLFVTA
ncbi:hypothetical protein [Microbacterium oleivorans]|uniref:Uncharacterized protein n=1 Tax=Microbacterium oleivorans TaxID=273677 RepID=A0A7D5EQZ8_9MICO|nr:hypothetical protein [Microbacterium oleivorans]QLD10645.1 hypothetical protein HW566_01930 [Microbacterium oleivorans]